MTPLATKLFSILGNLPDGQTVLMEDLVLMGVRVSKTRIRQALLELQEEGLLFIEEG